MPPSSSLTGLQNAAFGQSAQSLSPEESQFLQGVQQRWQQFPGSAPNGTGQTGLATDDLSGYTKMQNENIAAQNLLNRANGKAPLSMNYKLGSLSSLPDPYEQTRASGRNPNAPIVGGSS